MHIRTCQQVMRHIRDVVLAVISEIFRACLSTAEEMYLNYLLRMFLTDLKRK